MKYIDADKLRAEIERRRLQNRYIDTEGYENELLEIIDSLQQEEPEVDLEKEIDRVIADYSFTKTIDSGGFKTTILDYPKIARHFYELGKNAK